MTVFILFTGAWKTSHAAKIEKLDQAYRVQDSVTQQRMDRGETLVGYKVGRTK